MTAPPQHADAGLLCLSQRVRETRIDLPGRRDGPGITPLEDEQDGSLPSLSARELGQLPDMPGSPGRDRIGEQGPLPFHEGDTLHFQDQPGALLPGEEKVEAGQAVRIMTTQRIGIGLDFHVFCQNRAGQFREVQGMDLSGKFKLNLKNLQVGQFSQFAGDFDGDGLTDFLQIGRGRTVTIHRGQAGCRYPSTPDLTLKLRQAPLDLGLVRVEDLNADGRSDLMIVQPDREPEPGVSAPVRLDLYLSGESR